MTRYTLEEAKYILGILAGRETGFTTATQSRDAIRTVLDHLAEEPECEHSDFSSQQIGSGMVRMMCHDCGEPTTNGVDDEQA